MDGNATNIEQQSNTDHLTITIRLIRSFEYRNIKNIVLKDIDSNMTINDLKVFINQGKY